MNKETVLYLHSGILSSHKKNKILSSAAKWRELKNFMVSEISQTQQDKPYLLSLVDGSLKQVNLKVGERRIITLVARNRWKIQFFGTSGFQSVTPPLH